MEVERWFIIFSSGDSSHSLVPHSSVLNAAFVDVGDTVTFFYNRESHIGKVVCIDEDREKLNQQLRKMSGKTKRAVKPKTTEVTGKRAVKPPQRFGNESTSDATPVVNKKRKSKNTEAEKMKKAGFKAMNERLLDSDIESFDQDMDHSHDAKETVKENKSRKGQKVNPLDSSSDESDKEADDQSAIARLEKALKETQAKLAELREKNIENDAGPSKAILEDEDSEIVDCPGNRSSPSSNSPEMLDTQGNHEMPSKYVKQLYGKDYSDDTMVNIGRNIYCKASVLEKCDKASHPRHLVRRMIPGVFRTDRLTCVTLTGQLPRAAGKGRYEGKEIDDLCPKAVAAIIDYTKQFCENMKWPVVVNVQELRDTITQVLGEIKRKNEPKNTPTSSS